MLIAIQTTTPDRPTAERIASELVERRLAACVQIGGPITSVYRWKDAVESGEEWLCTAKTTAEKWPEVEQAILELHPYDTPEIIAIPITAASESYARWLSDQVSPNA